MKKRLMLLCGCLTVLMINVCYAAGEGTALTKEQKVVENLVAGLNDTTEATYKQATSALDTKMKEKLNEDVYNNMKKSIKEEFGSCKELQFRSFERLGDVDRVLYLAKYSKKDNVIIVSVFNMDGKMISFMAKPIVKNK